MADSSEEQAPITWLVRHVSASQVVLTDLLRLTDCVPRPFLDAAAAASSTQSSVAARSPTARVLFDFSYLRHSEALDAAVYADQVLCDTWDELRETYGDQVARFYQVW
jgi:Hereditary spastic paraplegia protein strumpellin